MTAFRKSMIFGLSLGAAFAGLAQAPALAEEAKGVTVVNGKSGAISATPVDAATAQARVSGATVVFIDPKAPAIAVDPKSVPTNKTATITLPEPR